jgi:nicotinamidase-related amidase
MPSKCALVVIDVQNGLITGPEPVHEAKVLLANISSLLKRARRRGAPVVYVQDDDIGPVGYYAWEIPTTIYPEAHDVRVRKAACDAFHETELDQRLREMGVGCLVVVGCKTEFCIDTTCRRAVTIGYHVTLVADVHATSDSPALAAPAIIAHHNRLLDGFGALVGGRPCEIRVKPAADIEF